MGLPTVTAVVSIAQGPCLCYFFWASSGLASRLAYVLLRRSSLSLSVERKIALTLTSLLTEVGTLVSANVSDLSVFIAGGLVIGLTATFVRKLIRSAR